MTTVYSPLHEIIQHNPLCAENDKRALAEMFLNPCDELETVIHSDAGHSFEAGIHRWLTGFKIRCKGCNKVFESTNITSSEMIRKRYWMQGYTRYRVFVSNKFTATGMTYAAHISTK